MGQKPIQTMKAVLGELRSRRVYNRRKVLLIMFTRHSPMSKFVKIVSIDCKSMYH